MARSQPPDQGAGGSDAGYAGRLHNDCGLWKLSWNAVRAEVELGEPSLFQEANRPHQPGGNRLQMVHVLHVETLAIESIQGRVIARRLACHLVDSGVEDRYLDPIFSALEELSNVDSIRRMPERSNALPVDGDYGCLADGRI